MVRKLRRTNQRKYSKITDKQSLSRPVSRFSRAKILVVGDLMLDEFVWGKVGRISPEAPVPVVWMQSESVMPGGAANVANNIRALGAHVSIAGVIGHDRWGTVLKNELKARKIGTEGLVITSRPTTVKTRIIAHHQQVVRLDREESDPLITQTIDRLIDRIKRRIPYVDAVIIEDYGKGVITRRLLEAIIPFANRYKRIVTVDPKEEHFDLYHSVSALTPNRSEAGKALGNELRTNEDVCHAGEEILDRLQCKALLMTLGEDGMCLFERSDSRSSKCTINQTWIPTVAQEVFDVAGAGDTVIATFTTALASRASMVEAAKIANFAAGIVVGKVGVGIVSPLELRQKLNAHTKRDRSSKSFVHSRNTRR